LVDADEVNDQGEQAVALGQLEETQESARRQPLWLGALLVAVVWLLARCIIAFNFAAARNPFSLAYGHFVGLDSFNYLNLANHAPSFGRCGYPPFKINAAQQLHQWWCGTAGWLPGYPLLIRVVHSLGIPLENSALLVSWLAIVASLALVWFAWLRELDLARSFLILLLFAIFPGAIFSFALYPMAVAVFFLTLAVFGASRDRLCLAATACVLAGLCYPTAWYAAAGLGVGIVLATWSKGTRERLRGLLWAAAGMAAIPLLFVYYWIAVGSGDAYFKVQSFQIMGRGYLFDILSLSKRPLTILDRGSQWYWWWGGTRPVFFLALQVVLIFVMVAVAAFVALRLWRRQGVAASSELFFATMAVGVVLGAVVFPSLSTWYRGIELAAPCVICFRRLPRWALIPLVIVVAIVTAKLSVHFFMGKMP